MERLTVIIIACLIFALQLLLCFKAKKLSVKLIPAVLLSAAFVISFILLITASGWDALVYIVFAMLSGIFLASCASGWLIWCVIIYFIKKRRL